MYSRHMKETLLNFDIVLSDNKYTQFLHSQLSAFGEIEDITILQPNGKFHYVYVKFKYRDDAIRSYLVRNFAKDLLYVLAYKIKYIMYRL